MFHSRRVCVCVCVCVDNRALFVREKRIFFTDLECKPFPSSCLCVVFCVCFFWRDERENPTSFLSLILYCFCFCVLFVGEIRQKQERRRAGWGGLTPFQPLEVIFLRCHSQTCVLHFLFSFGFCRRERILAFLSPSFFQASNRGGKKKGGYGIVLLCCCCELQVFFLLLFFVVFFLLFVLLVAVFFCSW